MSEMNAIARRQECRPRARNIQRVTWFGQAHENTAEGQAMCSIRQQIHDARENESNEGLRTMLETYHRTTQYFARLPHGEDSHFARAPYFWRAPIRLCCVSSCFLCESNFPLGTRENQKATLKFAKWYPPANMEPTRFHKRKSVDPSDRQS